MNQVEDIVEMDFVDDLAEDGDEERFRKHNRFLRTLKEDTILIIDNFNTTATGDALLPVVMKYRCRILFTTRSHLENETELQREDVFPYMEKYRYIQGMELILKELTDMLDEQGIGTISERALFLDYRAVCEKNLNKAIRLEKEAVALLVEITSDNALLASNLYANLGGLYKQNGNLEQAKQAMEEGIRILNEYGLVPYHDSIAQITIKCVSDTKPSEAHF